MSEALSAEDLKAIHERANHAGGGPWEIFQHGDGSWLIRHYAGGMVADAGFSNANADFIAHSRTDIPALLAEIARLSKIEERAKHRYTFFEISEPDAPMMAHHVASVIAYILEGGKDG